jgi:glycosyltransferase involved in cell wall biosynthesis
MIVDCIIPLFNKKNFISKAIESAINQRIKKFNNIIVVNDGSTDGGELIIKKLSKNYPSLKIINQINLGSSEARNVGIKKSNADYLVFLDADDQLHSKYLFCLHLMKFHNPDFKVFSTKHFNIYNNKEIIENSNNLKIFKSKIIKLNNPILNYSINPKLFCSSGICIKKNLILNNLFPKNINVGEDIYTWLKIFKNNKLILYNKELIYIFKISENRSIDIFQEIPYYFKKIYEFNKLKKISYYIYFLISSLIYFFQTKHNPRLNKEFINLIKSQSLSIFFFLKIFNNNLADKTYNAYKKIKYKRESTRKTK